PAPFAPEHRILTLFCFLAAGLVFARHRANILRLLHGTENRLKDSPAMFLLTKIVHVLALGLWFGTLIFFVVVGLSLFHTFEAEGMTEAEGRPSWFPLPPKYNKPEDLDIPLNPPKEQGTRAAGFAVGPMFGWYFLLQGVCGFLAVATALNWSWAEPHNK